ncbi:MAG TPA: TonB-dependent receptor, partial [Methylophilaceae bacterium]|nr:TonB-dependent receptor [Methylophilaceae bacterium]
FMKFYRRVLSLAVLATPGLALADHIAKEPLTLDTVTVVEKRDPLGASMTQPDLEHAREEIDKTPGGVTIVDTEQVREGRVSNFNDTLGMATGVFAQSRFGAEESRLSIRGSGLQRTFHGRGIKLMQDGIPVNLADGSFDFQTIEPMATRYIEVYRGANALRYGASTLGGAINFISPTGYDAPLLEARGELGSFDYQRFGSTTGGFQGNLDYFINSSTFSQDGFRDNARQEAQRTNANIGYRFNENLETRFYMGYANSNSELPGNLTKAQLKDDPSQAILSPLTGQQRRNMDVWRFANKTTLRLENTLIELGAYYSDKTLFHPIFQVLDQNSYDYGISGRLTHTGELLGHKNEFVVGLSPSRGVVHEDRWVNNLGSRGARTNKNEQIAENLEAYAENRWYATPDLALITGLQYTHATRKLNDEFFATPAQDESFDVTYVQTSPKLGLLYDLQPNIQLYTNVSRSFEPPSFGELAGGLVPNISKAQSGTTFEVGSRGNTRIIDWDISLYYARLHDELLQTAVFVAGNSAAPASQTTNASRTIHAGVEMGMTAHLPHGFEWRHNLLINDFRFDDDDTYGNRYLPGIPRSLLRGELMWRHGGFYMGPTVETSPQKYAVDFTHTLYADSYTIFGWKMGQKVNERLSWFLEGRNLTDRKYAATTSVVRDQNGTDGALFLPGDGRSAYLGVQFRY